MASQRTIAIAGIHTGIGKTIVSAMLVQALKADYWKPVQAGTLDNTDLMTVQGLVANEQSVFHPEALSLQMAASPHAAAANENLTVDCRDFSFPRTGNTLLVETAGGLLSPMDDRHTMADFISYHRLPTVLVTRHYLGSINHTLLCLEVMRQRQIPLACLVINGPKDEASESFIRNYTGAGPVLCAPELKTLTREQVSAAAATWEPSLLQSIFYEQY
jgi:dethiobiotin synthetase